MSAVRRIAPLARSLVAVGTTRGFRITINRGRGDTFGLTLEETYGESTPLASNVTSSSPIQTGRIVDAVFAAVRLSGHQPSIVAFTRQKPISLEESEGIRLALIVVTTQPISKHERVRFLVAGINAMSREETYYWYGKCFGIDANRARRALRTLLADD